MNNENHTHNIKEKVLQEIRSGEVVMTSKYHFTLKILGITILAFTILAISIFMINFILFTLHINSQDALLGFGARGITLYLQFFPWHLLLLDILLIVILRKLLEEFKVSYKIPTLYFLLGILSLSLVMGVILEEGTPFNKRAMNHDERIPPPLRNLYDRAQKHFPRGSGICRCTLLAINTDSLLVGDAHNGSTTLTVFFPPRVIATSSLRIGDTLFIAGEEKDGIIRAFGIRRDNGMNRYRP